MKVDREESKRRAAALRAKNCRSRQKAKRLSRTVPMSAAEIELEKEKLDIIVQVATAFFQYLFKGKGLPVPPALQLTSCDPSHREPTEDHLDECGGWVM